MENTTQMTGSPLEPKKVSKSADIFFTCLDWIKKHKGVLIQWGSFLLVVILFAILTKGKIFSKYNLKTLVGQSVSLMIMCCGMVFVFSHGGFDIASGAVVGLCSLVMVLTINATENVGLSILISIVLAIALYGLECFISVKLGLIPTIGSLAIMFSCRGIITYVCSLSDGVVHINNFALIKNLKSNWVLQLVMMIVVALLCVFLFNFTKIGKKEKAMGDNLVSAEQSGVHINAMKYFSYLFAGLLVGIASIFVMARSGNIGKSIGSGTEMDIMIAIILGGMNLNGGSKSKMSAAIIGCLTYRLLSNGMTMSGVPTNYISLVKGLIFLVIIFLTLRQSKNIKEMPR
jgi:ribose transport system permease protein